MGKHTSTQAVAGEQGRSTLGELIHVAVRRAIEATVEAELAATLGAGRYERRVSRHGYRNGTKTRTLSRPTGALALTLPRATLATGTGRREWTSTVVSRYQRRLQEVNAAVLTTYLAGGNTRRIRGAPWRRCSTGPAVAQRRVAGRGHAQEPHGCVADAPLGQHRGRLRLPRRPRAAGAQRGQGGARPGPGCRGRARRRPEGAGGVGPVRRRVVRGVEGVPGRPRRGGAAGAAALHHRRPRRLAARRRGGLGPGGGATPLRPHAAEPGAQGAQACPGRAPRRLPPDRLCRECGGGAGGLDRLRAGVGDAVSWRGQEPPGRGRGAVDLLQLSDGA